MATSKTPNPGADLSIAVLTEILTPGVIDGPEPEAPTVEPSIIDRRQREITRRLEKFGLNIDFRRKPRS